MLINKYKMKFRYFCSPGVDGSGSGNNQALQKGPTKSTRKGKKNDSIRSYKRKIHLRPQKTFSKLVNTEVVIHNHAKLVGNILSIGRQSEHP